MQRFKNILALYDPKPEGMATLKRAVSLAKRNQARLTVVDVIEELKNDVKVIIKSMPHQDLQKLVIEEQNRHLKSTVKAIRDAGVRISVRVLTGTPFIEIIREVLRNKHDLVIKTAQGAGRLKEMLFGSTAMHLMRKCPCPVWVMKPTETERYERILAAVDPDPSDDVMNKLNSTIMDLATSLARLEQSELHVLHTWTLYGETILSSGRSELPAEQLGELLQGTQKIRRKWLDELLEKFSLVDLKHQVHLLKGEPDKLIPELTQKKQIDLMVMGTVCRTGLRGFLIGNTAEKVLHQVNCSVLAVKPEGFESPVTLDK